MTARTARSRLFALMAIKTSKRILALNAYRAEVLGEMGPNDQETLADAATAYRHLRPMIEATMADSSRWDGDADEATILGGYVQWLAAERARVRTEVLAEAGGFVRVVASQLGLPLDITNMLCEDLDGAEAGKDPREGESTQPTPGMCGRALSTGEPCPDHPAPAQRTERSYWVAIADALNAANAAGMPVGINMEGILTDHNAWAVVWNRELERWEVGGYDDDPPAAPADPDRWLRCSWPRPSCPNAERARYAIERGWTQEGRAGDWLCSQHAPGGQPPATVEFSDGSVTLTRWDIVELAPDYYGHTFMQIGGWLPEGWKPGSISLGTNCMVNAELPGSSAHAHNVNVQIDVKGYGGPQRFMKIQWRHAYDPAKDHRRTGGERRG